MSTLIAIMATLAILRPEPVPADIAWVASGAFCEPETVLPLPDDTLLVSNVCGFQEPGTGFLTLLDADGGVIEWRIVAGLDAPTGMALRDDRLFIVDKNCVKVFTWPEYELLETIDLDTEVANDIAVSRDGTIYVSDTAGDKAIEIGKDRRQSVLTGKSQFQGANGIHVNGDTLYIGGSRLWRVDLKDHSVTTIGPEWLTDIDGIEMERNGTLQLTPVAGPLVRFCNNDRVEILGGEGISSANHGYAANLGLALIPTGFDNTVIAVRINETW
jgi:hypothetical protein